MSIRVLIADESSTMRRIMIRSLNSADITEVVEAGNGAEALRLFAQANVQLVLLEWHMPEKNGLDVLQEIRAQGSAVPVVMVTAEAKPSCVTAAIRAGATDYIIRPFTADFFRQKIEHYCAMT